jgi:hypothetical protein
MAKLIIHPQSDPLTSIKDDYLHASLCITWNWDTKKQKASLIFGTIELLPSEFPKSEEEQLDKCRLSSKSSHYLYRVKRTIKAKEAVEIYKHMRAKSGQKLKIASIEIKGKPLVLSVPSFSEEPIWPNLVTISSDGSPVLPFFSFWQGHARIHHLLCEDLNMDWNYKEEVKAEQWLTERLHFSWSEHEELQSSCHLIAIDPLFREIGLRLKESKKGEHGESIRFTFILRTNKDFEHTKLWVTEKRRTGFGKIWETEIDTNVIVIDFGNDLDTFEYKIICPKRGVLQHSPETHFLKSINLNMNLIREKRIITKFINI